MTPDLASHQWPTALDVGLMSAFMALVVVVPAIGYVFMVLDIRAYLRSLRGGLVQVGHFVTDLPPWVHRDTPRPIAALGLRMPCTEEDMKRAYRTRVKKLHPDHGGDQRRFLLLQAHFEEGLAILSRDPLSAFSP